MVDLTATAASAVREALRARGLRQREAAEELGISQQALSDRLVGRRPFKIRDLEHLAVHLGINVAELLEPPAALVDEPTAVAS